jgi:MoxR-like ATPase|tara:strand:+ start:283 stop:2226 length:1944 start_codon:yes stop_codon:yes gene_type:complete
VRATSSVFKDIFENYQKDYEGPFDSSKPSYSLFKELDEHIKKIVDSDDNLETHWSVGKGNWTQVPWFAVRDRTTKSSAQKGIGIVGLFKKDMSGLYLCIAQGTTQPLKDYGKKGGEEFLLEQAEKVRDIVKDLKEKQFKLDNEIDLKATGGVALTYKPSVCVHKYMSAGYDFDVQFIDDLSDLVKAYKDVVAENLDFTSENNFKKNHWVIGCGVNSNQWENFKKNNLIAIGWDNLGDLSKFKSKQDIFDKLKDEYRSDENDPDPRNDALCCYDFVNTMKVNDVVFVKKGTSKLIAYGRIIGDYRYDENLNDYRSIRSVEWINITEKDIKPITGKTLTNFNKYPETVDLFLKLMSNENNDKREAEELKDTFFSEEFFNNIIATLKVKKNIILQGPPGTGKTFISKKIANKIAGKKENIFSIQFHQSYSYEEFVIGYKPNSEGNFAIQKGSLIQICEKAQQNESENFVMFIDEINRANISKVFGELLSLIENDKRGPENAVKILYSENDMNFYIPSNLYFICAMNTADRSLKMVDYALRRRFSFFEFKPEFNKPEFKNFLKNKNVNAKTIDRIVNNISKVNQQISDDNFELGDGYCIGHSYFCPKGNLSDSFGDQWYEQIIEYEIKPLINEYYFDKPDQASELIDTLYD